MMPRIEPAQVRQPTLNRHAAAQTNRMPMVAIESHHIDCLHGPIIVSPLDLIEICDKKSDAVIATQPQKTQTEFEHLKTTVQDKQSKAAQTDFTSFTRPTHYDLPDNYFDKYLVVDSSEDSDLQTIAQKAKAFNQDFFMRFGHLFPIKFITAYFHSTYQQSKL